MYNEHKIEVCSLSLNRVVMSQLLVQLEHGAKLLLALNVKPVQTKIIVMSFSSP